MLRRSQTWNPSSTSSTGLRQTNFSHLFIFCLINKCNRNLVDTVSALQQTANQNNKVETKQIKQNENKEASASQKKGVVQLYTICFFFQNKGINRNKYSRKKIYKSINRGLRFFAKPFASGRFNIAPEDKLTNGLIKQTNKPNIDIRYYSFPV